MHYKLLVFTRELPTEEEIEDLMMPYNEDSYYSNYDDEGNYIGVGKEPERPVFTWDWYQIGGRYSGQIAAEVSTIDDLGIQIRNINRKEVISRLFDKYEWETDCYGYIREGERCIRCDGAYVPKIKNENAFGCYAFIGIDGKARARETWNGKDFIPDREFEYWLDISREAAIAENAFMTIIDIHD